MDAGAAATVHDTIEYRADRWLVGWLPYTLLLAAAGLLMTITAHGKPRFSGSVVLLIGACLSLFLLYRLWRPGPSRLTLSPAGLQLYAGRRFVLIPWREVQSIETVDLKVRNSGRGSWLYPYITLHDCTVVKVSRTFYDEVIHIPSILMRGPGWDGVFQPDGTSMRIGLHHEQFCITPQEVRAPIEVRWRTFRGRSHAASRAEEQGATTAGERRRHTSRTALSEPVRYGSAILIATPWDAVKLAVALTALLVVGSNGLGLWETATQEKRRLAREAAAEEARKDREERDRQKKKWDDIWKDFDRSMRRMDGDFGKR